MMRGAGLGVEFATSFSDTFVRMPRVDPILRGVE